MALVPKSPVYGFISTGDKIAMYTLRFMYDCDLYISRFEPPQAVFKDFYAKNLSTDKAKAEAAARDICESMGIPFKGDASFELNEIRRRRSEEVQRAIEEYERAKAAREKEEREEYERQVSEGVLLIGKYTGWTPADVYAEDPVYILRYLKTAASEALSKYDITISVIHKWAESNPVRWPEYVGTEGDKIQLKVRKIGVGVFEGYYGVSYILKMITENGDIVNSFTSSRKLLDLDDGEWFTVEGIVKKHEVYCGLKNTILARPKLVVDKKNKA